MNKELALQKIKEAMAKDRSLPLIKTHADIIPGDGNPSAEIVFIGEAGGYHESIKRKPFVGNAGMLLNQLLGSINIPRETVYITNMIKARPPDNRDPLPEELAAFEKYLDQELKVIDPKIIVTLGRFSMGKFLPNARITSTHGKVHALNWKGKEIKVIPMYHPAAGLRNPNMKQALFEDFKKIPETLEKIKTEKNEEVKEMPEQMSLV